jgi:hypothetical protein
MARPTVKDAAPSPIMPPTTERLLTPACPTPRVVLDLCAGRGCAGVGLDEAAMVKGVRVGVISAAVGYQESEPPSNGEVLDQMCKRFFSMGKAEIASASPGP